MNSRPVPKPKKVKPILKPLLIPDVVVIEPPEPAVLSRIEATAREQDRISRLRALKDKSVTVIQSIKNTPTGPSARRVVTMTSSDYSVPVKALYDMDLLCSAKKRPAPGTDDDEPVVVDVVDSGRKSRIKKKTRPLTQSDLEDLHLYGAVTDNVPVPVHQSLADETLTRMSLPKDASDFVRRLLCLDLSEMRFAGHAIRDMYRRIKSATQLDLVNVFQVSFISCLLMELQKRIKSSVPLPAELFHPYLKQAAPDGLLRISCFYFSPENQEPVNSFGSLARVRLVSENKKLNDKVILAFVEEADRRLPELSCMPEVSLLKARKLDPSNTMVHDVTIIVPFTPEMHNGVDYLFEISSLCQVNDLLMQSKAVYDISVNFLFRYLQKQAFDIQASGSAVTCSADKYSAPQLEAIQRSLDLALAPVSAPGNPVKAMLIDGFPEDVSGTVIEIVHQFMTNTSSKGMQLLITSSSRKALADLTKKLVSRLASDSKDSICEQKHIFLLTEGKAHKMIKQFSLHYMKCKLDHLKDTFAAATEVQKKELDKKIKHYEDCMDKYSHMYLVKSLPVKIQVTVDEYEEKAMRHALANAHILLGSIQDLSRQPDVMSHLQQAKQDATQVPLDVPVLMPGAKKKEPLPIANILIADIEDMSDPELMLFVKEFEFSKFILTSSWSPARDPVSDVRIDRSLKQRLLQLSSTNQHPLVINVSKK